MIILSTQIAHYRVTHFFEQNTKTILAFCHIMSTPKQIFGIGCLDVFTSGLKQTLSCVAVACKLDKQDVAHDINLGFHFRWAHVLLYIWIELDVKVVLMIRIS